MPAFKLRASGDEETRTPDPRLAKAVLSQLSYIPFKVRKVGLVGLEPTTSPLSEERSNRLSYRPSLRKKAGRIFRCGEQSGLAKPFKRLLNAL